MHPEIKKFLEDFGQYHGNDVNADVYRSIVKDYAARARKLLVAHDSTKKVIPIVPEKPAAPAERAPGFLARVYAKSSPEPNARFIYFYYFERVHSDHVTALLTSKSAEAKVFETAGQARVAMAELMGKRWTNAVTRPSWSIVTETTGEAVYTYGPPPAGKTEVFNPQADMKVVKEMLLVLAKAVHGLNRAIYGSNADVTGDALKKITEALK